MGRPIGSRRLSMHELRPSTSHAPESCRMTSNLHQIRQDAVDLDPFHNASSTILNFLNLNSPKDCILFLTTASSLTLLPLQKATIWWKKLLSKKQSPTAIHLFVWDTGQRSRSCGLKSTHASGYTRAASKTTGRVCLHLELLSMMGAPFLHSPLPAT